MNNELQTQIDAMYAVLAKPIDDVGVISRMLPSPYSGIACFTTLADRTFFVVTCGKKTPDNVVFFLSESGNHIEFHIVGAGKNNLQTWCEMIRSEDQSDGDLCITGMSQILNPVFNSGAALLTGVTLLLGRESVHSDKIIGIVMGFPFGIRLGLHVFDDHRLSICFNENCDAIISQARGLDRVHVIERTFTSDEKPHFSNVNWFDWLSEISECSKTIVR